MKKRLGIAALFFTLSACHNETGPRSSDPREGNGGAHAESVKKLLALRRERLSRAHAPGLATGILPNGLTFYILQAHSDPAVALMQVDVGMTHETAAERGYAHFVEHMVFEGTTHFPGRKLYEQMDAAGLALGPDVNAWTGLKDTTYMFNVPRDDRGALSFAVQALRGMADAAHFPPERVLTERKVVVEELLGYRPEHFEAGEEGHTDGQQAKKLQIASVRAATPAWLRAFYEHWYQPARIAVVVVSPWPIETVRAEIEESFSSLRPGQNGTLTPPFKAQPIEHDVSIDTSSHERLCSIALVDERLPQGPAAPKDEDQARVQEMFCSLLLTTRLRSALSASSHCVLLDSSEECAPRAPAQRRVFFMVAQDDTLPALRQVSAELNRLDSGGYLPEEVQKAKASILSGLELSRRWWRQTSALDRGLELLRNFSTGELVRGAEAEASALLGAARSLSPADAVKCAFPPGATRRTIKAWLTDATKAVDAAALLEARNTPPPAEPWEPKPTFGDKLRQLPVVPAVSGEIVAVAEEVQDRAERLTLANGVTVLLKRTQFEPGRVAISGEQDGGLNNVPRSNYSVALVASQIMPNAGTSQFGTRELHEALSNLGTTAHLWLSDHRHGMFAAAPASELPTALKSLYLLTVFPGPRAGLGYTPSDFAEDDETPAPDALLKRGVGIAKRGPRGRSAVITEELAAQVEYDEVLAFWKQAFQNARGFRFAVVGDFDPDQARAAIRKYLGGLPAMDSAPRLLTPTNRWYQYEAVPLLEGRAGSDTYNRVQLGFQARLHTIELTRAYAEVVERIVRRRLYAKLEGDLGSVYTVQVAVKVDDPYVALEVNLNTSVNDVHALHGYVLRELEALSVAGPDDTELQSIVHQLENSHKRDLESNGWWAHTLLAYERGGFEAHARVDPASVWRAMNPEHFQRTIRAFIDGQQYRVVVRPRR